MAASLEQAASNVVQPGPREDAHRRAPSLGSKLKKIEGRGKVRLVQEPNSWNDSTAKVRIEDDKGGSDDYEFELTWKR